MRLLQHKAGSSLTGFGCTETSRFLPLCIDMEISVNQGSSPASRIARAPPPRSVPLPAPGTLGAQRCQQSHQGQEVLIKRYE